MYVVVNTKSAHLMVGCCPVCCTSTLSCAGVKGTYIRYLSHPLARSERVFPNSTVSASHLRLTGDSLFPLLQTEPANSCAWQLGFSIMFGTSAAPPNGNGDGKDGENDAGSGDGETSHPWGAGGGNASPGGGGGKGGSTNWQSSSSLSWLTNLRKGIMSGGEKDKYRPRPPLMRGKRTHVLFRLSLSLGRSTLCFVTHFVLCKKGHLRCTLKKSKRVHVLTGRETLSIFF